MLCDLMKILSHASAIKKAKALKGFRFCTFFGRFQVTSDMAVKGLRDNCPLMLPKPCNCSSLVSNHTKSLIDPEVALCG